MHTISLGFRDRAAVDKSMTTNCHHIQKQRSTDCHCLMAIWMDTSFVICINIQITLTTRGLNMEIPLYLESPSYKLHESVVWIELCCLIGKRVLLYQHERCGFQNN